VNQGRFKSGYTEILKQVRNQEFDHEIHQRLELAAKEQASAVELARSQQRAEMQEALSPVEKERDSLKSQLEAVRRENEAAQRLAEASPVTLRNLCVFGSTDI